MKYSQLDVVKSIEKFVNEKGFSPTALDVCNYINVRPVRKMKIYLNRLEELEIIEKQQFFPRAIRITDKGRELMKAYEIIGY